jgi:mono/diheme cytochrome c family protein
VRLARLAAAGALLTALLLAVVPGPNDSGERERAAPPDDAKAAGKTAADFPEIAADVFKEMDGCIALDPAEIEGRNDWILWTAGNQLFWDRVARSGFGLVDLLKTIDSRSRPRRFAEMGLINEPGFRMAAKPDEFGLWLDERVGPPPAGLDESVYGRSTGIIGFRLYPNPDFDGAARKRWDPARYDGDPAYYNDPTLVRPYRVGVSCGLCHAGFNPLVPPQDPENPAWRNLSSAIGNQYIREGRVFTRAKPGSFFWEMLNAQPPGTSDTSRAATDHINNPGAVNGIFELGARLAEASEERLSGGALAWPGPALRPAPHFLKDGADSIGPAGAMMRVYVNEGLYSQQWLGDHDLLIGVGAQKPFSVAGAFVDSVYWQATYARTANIARFFLRLGPMPLAGAPGGSAYISRDPAVLARGGAVFADNCAACHSSKQPPPGVEPGSAASRQWYRESVASPDFRQDNFLSDDRRYSILGIKTNACRALASNATRGHVWDNFSSETYKSLPSVGSMDAYDLADPVKPYRFAVPGGGPGYYRPPSLVALWSSAPFLHNNALGAFTGDPSVAGRLRAFDDAVEKLLWPEKRLGAASIWRTAQESYVEIAEARVPLVLRPLVKGGVLRLGPIPKGTPINLLANLDPTLPNMIKLIPALNAALVELAKGRHDLAAIDRDETRRLVAALMSASLCPDLIEDRGHEFGTRLPDADKRALIEFLKTL